MFRKLRLQLTLINVLVMALVILFFVAATYFLMEYQMFSESQQIMKNIAADAGSGSIHSITKSDRRYFLIKTDKFGSITDSSQDLPLTGDELSRFIERAPKKFRFKGEVEWHDVHYHFLKVPLQQDQGFLFVFVNVQQEKVTLALLLVVLIITGLICLGLGYYGSLWLADRAMIPIKNSWQRQKDFVADASHEFRTPLAVIQTNLELVMGNPEDTVENQSKWLENIRVETKHMTKLVSDLLFLARADSQQQLLDMKRFPLHTALQNACEPFKPLAEIKGIQLHLSLESFITFYGDEDRIKQLVMILLDNTLKHTPPGGNVSLTLQKRSTTAEITVSDTGEGIEQQHLPKIFERFYRVDNARSKQEGGTGLGLAIAAWIVKAHQGTIKVDSTPGLGTTFVISFLINPKQKYGNS